MKTQVRLFHATLLGFALVTGMAGLTGCQTGDEEEEEETEATDEPEAQEGTEVKSEEITEEEEQKDPDAPGANESVSEEEKAGQNEFTNESVPGPNPADPGSAFGSQAEAQTPSAPPPQTQTQNQVWVPNNNGTPPDHHLSQADLRMSCRKIGPGVESGYVRYGCNALKRSDGQHYGIVRGWWAVFRRDGGKAKARDLNFREAGYDMAFDVVEMDARAGILVRPGAGETGKLGH